MREFKGDIIENMNLFDAVCITTNGVVKNDGRLVMGAGVAKAFRDTFKGIDKKLGDLVKENGNQCYVVDSHKLIDIISFPTKGDWRDDSSIMRIKLSCLELMEIINIKGYDKVALPKPGCTNGGLDWEYVREEIRHILDDRVVIIDKP